MQTISIALETSPEQPPLTGQETAMVKPLSVKLRLNKREERERSRQNNRLEQRSTGEIAKKQIHTEEVEVRLSEKEFSGSKIDGEIAFGET